MGKVIRSTGSISLEEVRAAITFDQPKLRAECDSKGIVVRGTYLLYEQGTIANPAGPLSEFDIEMYLDFRFPDQEPKVFEVGGRIPRHPDRHINPDGDCCVTVWEHWLVFSRDHSFTAFLNGPLQEYFLGQYWYEKTGKWPFGERTHGRKGLEEAYADALELPNNRKSLAYHLKLLSQDWPKGHWPCPCGSGRRLRNCHRDDLMDMHRKVSPRIAKRMLRRLKSQSP